MSSSASQLPLVSVVIPAFNAETTLAESLASAAAQTYPNLEILIVDDGSTDATPEIAAAFCARAPHARVLRKPNGGVASARNCGIEGAKGEWIAPLDADDLWHPTKIAKQVDAALNAPRRPGFVYCWHQYIDERGEIRGSGPRVVVNGRGLRQLSYLNFVGNGSAPLIWRQALLEAGGYDASLRERGGEGCEDQKLQLQIARRHPIVAVAEDLIGYRSHPGSMSRRGRQMFRSWQLLVDDFEREGLMPRRIARWVLGECNSWLADTMIAERSFGAAVRALAAALWLDPSRSAMMIPQRLARLAVRVLVGARPMRASKPFGSITDGHPVPLDQFELKLLARAVRRIDTARMRRLAAEEPELEANFQG